MDGSPPPRTDLFSYTRFTDNLSVVDGRIDVVGDVHGCMDELMVLLAQAGYWIAEFNPKGSDPIAVIHPQGRKLIFVGDLTDRGPSSDQVLRLAMGAIACGTASCVMGNHDWKIYRALCGRKVTIDDSTQETLDQIASYGEAFEASVRSFYESIPHQIRIPLSWEHGFDGAQNLWIVHASAKAHRQGGTRSSDFARSIYGYGGDDVDEKGWMIREDWAASYEGADPVIHGHVIHAEPVWKNRVLCLDTGCAFGNKMTLYQVDQDTFLFSRAERNYSGQDRILA